MRIEFYPTPWPCRSYYAFNGEKIRIRSGKAGFYWEAEGGIYETCASNDPTIYRNGEIIAKRRTSDGKIVFTWSNPVYIWQITQPDGRKEEIFEMRSKNKSIVHWKSSDGKQIMTFRRVGCGLNGAAVFRSDWADRIGLLVGLVVPEILSTG